MLLLLLTGCMTTWTHPGVEPGPLALPSAVDRLVVIDRTAGGTGTDAVVGFSGVALERGGVSLASAEVVAAALAGDAAALLKAPVGPESALAGCARTDADALVTAWRVEPDPFWNFEKEDGAWSAHYNARARVAFRVWDCAGRRLHDVVVGGWHTTSATGEDRPSARSAVTRERMSAADRAAVADAGRKFASQVVPAAVMRRRPVFHRGGLRPGVTALQEGRLEDAHGIFLAEATTLDPRRRARALHDLAVVSEALGDLEAALDQVTEAVVLDAHPATLALRASLMRRAVMASPEAR